MGKTDNPKLGVKKRRKKEKHPLNKPTLREPNLLSFSFKCLELNSKQFPISKCGSKYLEKLLERFKNLSSLYINEIKFGQYGDSLRVHSHDVQFQNLPEQISQCKPYQISLSGKGRVHGVFLDDIFYVVLLDPNHDFYP